MARETYVDQCLKRMQVWMDLRALKPNTVSTYLRCARRFIAHVDKPLGSVRAGDVQDYLLDLVRKERSPRTRQRQPLGDYGVCCGGRCGVIPRSACHGPRKGGARPRS